ncbi:MAG: serine O-acetyltransferase [Actinomycetota bacterium]
MKGTPFHLAWRLLRDVVAGLPARVRRNILNQAESLISAIEADLTMKTLCDPSVGSVAEAASSAGCRGLATHRVAHLIAAEHGRPLARRLAEGIVGPTGVDVHYSASIAPGVALDHSPVIIGETSVVGRGVYLAGATLGTRQWPAEAGSRRHPTIGEDSFVGPRALILGRVTIGARCRIGAGAVVTSDLGDDVVVAAHALVKAPVGAGARVGYAAVVLSDVAPGARVGDRATWTMLQTT